MTAAATFLGLVDLVACSGVMPESTYEGSAAGGMGCPAEKVVIKMAPAGRELKEGRWPAGTMPGWRDWDEVEFHHWGMPVAE